MQRMLDQAVEKVRARDSRRPAVSLILGSGLGALADEITDGVAISFADIPGFPAAAIAGHAGRLVIGNLEGVTCAVLQGRFHMYEGHDAAAVALPARMMMSLGASTLIVTNAAGGINRSFVAGDLMLIDDHINFTARSPLTGSVLEGETRFPDMTEAYNARLRGIARAVAARQSIRLVSGVYAAVPGPSYETPAEIRMLERLGADAIGMSTVPEVIVARARNVPVLGISLITNLAAGISANPLSHEEVVAAGTEARGRFTALIRGVIREMDIDNA
ncbi:MAG TPA: purine-nucleoside phosphorylase [Longimicrobiales bacterium]|nr:purine-nucleoside phosphorylase [Longimicrobiales bacterium]